MLSKFLAPVAGAAIAFAALTAPASAQLGITIGEQPRERTVIRERERSPDRVIVREREPERRVIVRERERRPDRVVVRERSRCRTVIERRTNRMGERVTVRSRVCD